MGGGWDEGEEGSQGKCLILENQKGGGVYFSGERNGERDDLWVQGSN